MDIESITGARREALAASIRTIGLDEVRQLGETLFPSPGHPWGEALFGFLDENAGATFHHAKTGDGFEIVYCGAGEKGFWFMPGGGMGPLQETGIQFMKGIAGGR